MSSTNRSDARSEHISDYYVTPVKDIELFLNELIIYEPDIFKGDKLILDPCAGGDEKNPMSYPEALKKFTSNNVVTMDIREDSLAKYKKDYLKSNSNKKWDVIITNPPFNIALEIIEKALEDVKDGGYVIMLLRLNFFGSKARYDFWQNYMAKYAFVHSKRMSFIKGATDSIEYAHLVFCKGYKNRFCMMKVI